MKKTITMRRLESSQKEVDRLRRENKRFRKKVDLLEDLVRTGLRFAECAFRLHDFSMWEQEEL